MSGHGRKRHIGIIPTRADRHQAYIEAFREVILDNWKIIPDTMFYNISFEKLLTVSRSGAAYDVVIASRMKDPNDSGINNIYSAALEIRNGLGLSTIFIISFNEVLATVRGLEVEAEQAHIRRLVEHEMNPDNESIGGVIQTSSTSPDFLISIVADVLPSSW